MPKSLIYTAIPVFLVTGIVWYIGVSNHTFLASEFWLYVGLFLVPASAVCGCAWLVSQPFLWRKAIGLVLILPCLGIWALSLLLVFNGFRVH